MNSGVSAKKRVLLLAGYGVVTFFSFPHPLGDRVVDFGSVLAWFGPALLLLGLTGLSPRRAAMFAFVFGMVLFAGEARAEDKQVVYQKHQVVVFGDHLLNGDITRPDQAYIRSIINGKVQKLIHVRSNFRRELLNSLR